MKEPFKLFESLYNDFQTEYSTNWSKDISTFKKRYTYEGLSFLTITLPSFSEQFFLCLEQKKVTSNFFLGWKKKLCLPAFLQGFTKLVFDQHTGDLLNEPSKKAIRAIRQICTFYKKVHIPCTKVRENKALENYVQTDCLLADTSSCDSELLELFEKVSRIIVSTFDRVSTSELIPHHGPGSTAEKLSGNKKFKPDNFSWYSCLDDCFSPDMIFNSEESYNQSKDDYKSVLSESTVRVITVPKTQKGPRVIAMEPAIMQMAQQSVKDFLVLQIESSPLTSGHINFKDQSINQRLALESSKTRAYATLDLKDASDRIHKDYVYKMFSVDPILRRCVFSTRSSIAQVFGSTKISLKKFASMGSALCFPIESLFFYMIIIVSLLKHNGLQPSYKNIQSCKKGVYIYGDDIIIPINVVDPVIATLSKFGNVVSLNKSFFKGLFRESCGVDAYNGDDITPIYLRSHVLQDRFEASELISLIDTANQFFDKCCYNTFFYIKDIVERQIGKLPTVNENSDGLGWRLFGTEKYRYNRKLQRREVLSFVPCIIHKKDYIKGYNALSKCLLDLELRQYNLREHSNYTLRGVTLKDGRHLDRTVRRGALILKRRWIRSH